MKKASLAAFFGALILTGAGCAGSSQPPATPPAADTAETTTAANAPVAAATTAPRNVPRQNATGQTPAPRTSPTNQPTPLEDTEADEPAPTAEESDQEQVQLFEYRPTHPRNYTNWQTYARYNLRMSKAIILAGPAGGEKYDSATWAKEDPDAVRTLNAAEAAVIAMDKAHKAFEAKSSTTESLVTDATKKIAVYYQTILAFESAWGVKGE